jgi:hypothetical protein
MIRFIYGLVAAAVVVSGAGAASAQVANGGFETGMASWTASGWVSSVVPHTGAFAADTACTGAACMNVAGGASISQTVATTSGASYTLSFWYRTTNGGDTPVELQALWSNGAPTNGGAGVCTGSCVFGTTTATAIYTQVTQTVVATGPTMQITFLGRNDPSAMLIDDVSLTFLAPPPVTVPTMTEWAMILFGVMLAGFAAFMVMRRQSVRV